MKKRNRLATSETPLESRVMLSSSVAGATFGGESGQVGGQEGISASSQSSSDAREGSTGNNVNVSRARFVIRNGEIISQDVDISDSGSLTLDVNGERVAEQSPAPVEESIPVNPLVEATPESAPQSSSDAEEGSTGNNANVSRARFVIRNGEIISQDVDISDSGSLTLDVNGERVAEQSPAPVEESIPVNPLVEATPESAPQSDAGEGSTGNNVNVSRARFVIVNGEIVSQDVDISDSGSLTLDVNGERVAEQSPAPTPTFIG